MPSDKPYNFKNDRLVIKDKIIHQNFYRGTYLSIITLNKVSTVLYVYQGRMSSTYSSVVRVFAANVFGFTSPNSNFTRTFDI